MMYIIKHLLEPLLHPYFLLLLALVCAIGLLLKHEYQLALIAMFFTMGGFLLFSTGFLPQFITQKLEAKYTLVKKANPEVHWIVVLGGGHAHDVKGPAFNILSHVSTHRFLEGVRLYRQLPNAKLILSGGDTYGGKTEAEYMENLSNWFAIPQNDIILEKQSINTKDEARLIKQWVKTEPFYLVTSATHMPRSMMLCKKQGLNPLAAPTDFNYFWNEQRWHRSWIPNTKNLEAFSTAWHEFLGMLWEKLTHVFKR